MMLFKKNLEYFKPKKASLKNRSLDIKYKSAFRE